MVDGQIEQLVVVRVTLLQYLRPDRTVQQLHVTPTHRRHLQRESHELLLAGFVDLLPPVLVQVVSRQAALRLHHQLVAAVAGGALGNRTRGPDGYGVLDGLRVADLPLDLLLCILHDPHTVRHQRRGLHGVILHKARHTRLEHFAKMCKLIHILTRRDALENGSQPEMN